MNCFVFLKSILASIDILFMDFRVSITSECDTEIDVRAREKKFSFRVWNFVFFSALLCWMKSAWHGKTNEEKSFVDLLSICDQIGMTWFFFSHRKSIRFTCARVASNFAINSFKSADFNRFFFLFYFSFWFRRNDEPLKKKTKRLNCMSAQTRSLKIKRFDCRVSDFLIATEFRKTNEIESTFSRSFALLFPQHFYKRNELVLVCGLIAIAIISFCHATKVNFFSCRFLVTDANRHQTTFSGKQNREKNDLIRRTFIVYIFGICRRWWRCRSSWARATHSTLFNVHSFARRRARKFVSFSFEILSFVMFRSTKGTKKRKREWKRQRKTCACETTTCYSSSTMKKTTEKFHMNVNFFTFLHFHAAMRLRQMKGIDQIKRNKLNQLNWNEFSLFFFRFTFLSISNWKKMYRLRLQSLWSLLLQLMNECSLASATN